MIVAQGVIENSNVQPVNEMTHMIHVARSLDSTAKFVSAVYEMQRKASNTWAQQA
jgi:flagellar basal body rod protein FlgG